MKPLAILTAALLAGCTPLLSYAPTVFPSLEYCDQVIYIRKGNQVDVQAQCRAPVR